MNKRIYTTYFANVRNLPSNIIPISIAGRAPDGWSGLEYKKLAPKWSFFKEWKKTHDNNYYIEHYNAEVLDKLNADEIINELFTLDACYEDCDIALVCYESPKDFCHRHLVAGWLNRNGYCVSEYIDMSNLKDTDDGITHINMYSKAKTKLGRMLSNFYEFPIETDDGSFCSVEGYWYWLSIDESIKEREELRNLSGFQAKNRGIEILKSTNDGKNNRFDPEFEHKILKAIWYKFRRNMDMILPEYRGLPIVHYYSYNGRIVDVTYKYPWMIDGLTKMRDYL